MTENKRFKLGVDEQYGAILDNDKIMRKDEIVELLNALHEENQHLKEALKELKEIGDYQADRIKELTEENQQIKSTIKEAYRNERTHIGESVLRQLINQIWSE